MNDQGADPGVWLIDLDSAAPVLLACEDRVPRLAPDEDPRAAAGGGQVQHRLRRAAYVARRLILERAFGTGLRGQPLPRDRYGRPALPGGMAGSVSLAHTGALALIAVSRFPRIGIDLECPRTIRMSDARRRLIEAAAASLSPLALPQQGDMAFLQAWVRLEALAKADGRGIGHILTRIGAVGQPPGSHGETRLHQAAGIAAGHGLNVHDLDAGSEIYAAIASQAATPPRVQHFPAGLEAVLAAL